MRCRLTILALVAGLIFSNATRPAGADTVKIGYVNSGGASPILIAQEKGYFAAEGLTAELHPTDSALLLAQACLTGDLDFGESALIAGHYNLAPGGLRLIAASSREVPGFQNTGYLASNRAWDGGLRSIKDLENRTIMVASLGGNQHYAVALLAEKYAMNMATMKIVQGLSLANVASAIAGGQPDFAILPNAFVNRLASKGDAHLLGWVGDETPFQLGAVYTAEKTGTARRPIVEAFLRAYRRGTRDYYDAFTGADGKRADSQTAAATLAILAKYFGQPPEQIGKTISYIDREARLDVKDVLRQITWLRSLGMVKPEIDAAALIDKRFVMPLLEK